MNISLNAVAFRNGKPFNTTLNLTKQSDGSWHATNFDKAMQGAYNASKGGAAQSRNVDTYTSGRSCLTRRLLSWRASMIRAI